MQEVAYALSQYPYRAEAIREWGQGSVSRVHLINLPEREAILKGFYGRIRRGDLEIIHAFQRHLLEQGVAVPRILGTRVGQDIVQTDSGLYALYEFIPGDSLDTERPEQVFAAGKLLGQLHAAGSNFQPDGSRNWWTSETYPFAEKLGQISSGVTEETEILKQGWEEISRRKWNGSPRTFIHGDFRPDNIIVGSRGVTAIDLDNCRREIPEMDFARVARHIWKWPEDDKWAGRAGIFLAGYKASGKTGQELSPAGLAASVIMQPMRESIWQLEQMSRGREGKPETGWIILALLKLAEFEKRVEEIWASSNR